MRNSNSRRVVITGLGAVTPIGNNIQNFWEKLIQGESGIDLISRFDTKYFKSKIAGQINDFNIKNWFPNGKIENTSKIDLAIQYGLCACKECIEDASIDFEDLINLNLGLILGQTVGGSESAESDMQKILMSKKLIDTGDIYYKNSIPAVLKWFSKIFDINGFANMLSTGCAAGGDAVGSCFHMIRDGFFDVGICGGIEAPIAPVTIAAFDVIRALSSRDVNPKQASCPFNSNRDGFIPSEGAGILLLEELEHAVKRKAKIYGEIHGYNNNSNAHHMTAPLPSGEMQGKAMINALRDAKISYDKIDYINAHGSSTPLNDTAETKAVKLAFKEHAKKLSISSTKSIIGHTLGASGALEVIITILASKYGIAPPTINLYNQDPECDLDYTPNHPVYKQINYAMSNSAGFSGVNCSIVISAKNEKNIML